VPGNLDRIAAGNFELACALALRQGLAVEANLDVGDAIGVVLGQLAVYIGEGAALEAEFDGLGDIQHAVGEQVPLDIEPLGRIALAGRDHTERRRGAGQHDEHDDKDKPTLEHMALP